MRKILTIIGARPQFIKAAPVSKNLAESNTLIEVSVHTGQHYDSKMSDIFFSELGIPEPKYNLDIGSATHGAQTGRMLEKIETVILQEEPDAVLVYGDTNSTLAGALAAAKQRVPVAHIEAGLRSFDKSMPEEINRVMTDHVSSLLFTPTSTADENLLNENFSKDSIHNVGDVMYDAHIEFKAAALEKASFLEDLDLNNQKFVLATIHRAENTDNANRLRRIISELKQLNNLISVVLPLHPRTKRQIEILNIDTGSIKTVEPLGFLEMIAAESSASLIVTDSGGVQKEAFFHQVPCITLRDTTEWIELLKYQSNILFPPIESNQRQLSQVYSQLPKQMHPTDNRPFGDGKAACKIVGILDQYLS